MCNTIMIAPQSYKCGQKREVIYKPNLDEYKRKIC